MTLTPGTEKTTADAFDKIAEIYDASFTNSAIGSAQRRSVWKEIDRNFTAGQRILEINCGTGVDALHLAGRRVHVTACDSAPRMIAVARQRADQTATSATVDFRVLANERIGTLRNEGPFDGVLSNFSGLNCIPDLSFIAYDLAQLIKKRSKMVLCLFGRFCIWETFWCIAQGNIRKAVRRVRQGGRSAVLSACSETTVWYHTVRHLKKTFHPYFRLVGWKGVGVTVPPSYLEFLAADYPRLFHIASRIDPWLGGCPGFRAMADHMLLTFERT
ncbi:MAG TPA: class I SAM-dependent methyltransferase [Terriglobia bacterium]|nr:class I SAM-dependent methyltransferase [Terriglobia bacterium]